ncbi:MAG: Ig-like domain-containing protein [Planctomycetota bacterium]|nr:Ig-like domain-containing protein [Planctomycetota bacterium]
MTSLTRSFALLCSIAMIFAAGAAQGQVSESPPPTARGVVVLAEIEHIFVDDMNDMFSAGWIIADGTAIRVPANLLIDTPANRMTLRDLMEMAPADCRANGESGLGNTEECVRSRGLRGGGLQAICNRQEDGFTIAGDIFINKSMVGNVAGGIVPPTLGGYISYVDHDQGYMVVNGAPGEKPFVDGGTDKKGIIVRINDPESRHTIQSGLGCNAANAANCSPDERFCVDPDNYSMTFSTGYPVCIPSSDISDPSRDNGADSLTGEGDEFCPMWNRNFVGPRERTVPDSRRFVPIIEGDPVGFEGNYEVVNGVRFFSTYGGTIQLGLKTKDQPDQPDHMIWAEVEQDTPPFDNARIKSICIAFTTLDSSWVDFYKIHKDPVSGEDMEYPWGSSVGNIGTRFHGMPPNAGGIMKVVYDVDFLLGAPVRTGYSPCQNLINAGFIVCPNGGTMAEEVDVSMPIHREMVGYSRHRQELQPGNEPLDMLGRVAQHGMYLTPSGVGHPEFVEINLNKSAYPFVFDSIPWNLDRRLGVGGCAESPLGDGTFACEDPSVVPIGTFALDPFPASGDPDWIQHTINNGAPIFATDRFSAYHPFGLTDIAPQYGAAAPARQFPPGLDGLQGILCDVANAAPIAVGDALSATEDTAVAISTVALLGNDSDPDSDRLELFMVDGTSLHGGSVSSDGTLVTFQSGQDYNGLDEFYYHLTDGHGGISRGKVDVTISPVNDAPVAQSDDITMASATPFNFADAVLLANDHDVDGDLLTITSISEINPTQSPGSVTGAAGGPWSFTATGPGLSSWQYTVDDSAGGSTISAVNFWVDNAAPVAVDDLANLDEDTPKSINALLNDSDADLGDTLSITSVSAPLQGTAEIVFGSTLLYTPDLDSNGTDSFTYTITDGKGTEATATVSLTINPINDAPRLFNDAVQTLEDTSVDIHVLANDYDPEGHNMTVSIPTTAAFDGTVTLLAGGILRFTPLPNTAIGLPANFIYIVTDELGAFSTALVDVLVIPVNDQPVTGIDTILLLEDTPSTLNVLLNDVDVDRDQLRVTSVTPPANFPGTVTWDMNGNVTITPDPDASTVTPLLISYVASDGALEDIGTINVVILPVNDNPVANDDLGNFLSEDSSIDIDVLANDTDVDTGDTLQVASVSQGTRGVSSLLANGSIRYTPNPNVHGQDLFTYTMHDGNGGQSTATVALTIESVNDVPVAGQLSILPMAEDGARFVSSVLLLSVASDADGDPLWITNVGQPINGQVTLNTDVNNRITSLTYQPNANFHGSDSISYEVTDDVIEGGILSSSASSVTFNILPVNDAPVAINDANLSVTGGELLSIAPLANDFDPDGDPLTLKTLPSGPFHGTATINTDGTLDYLADENFDGSDTILYVVSDGHGGASTASIVISVTAPVSTQLSVIRGDANIDGQLDVSDPVETVLYLFDADPVACLLALDSNDDEYVDLGDIIFSLNNLFSTGADPAAPFPFCGLDPTTGGLPCAGFGLCD